MKNYIPFVLTFLFCLHLPAAEWQWSTDISNIISDETRSNPQAFLWIPPDCMYVKGVVIAQHNMSEEGILEHARFRKGLSDLGFAEIWITPFMDISWDEKKGVQEIFKRLLNDLAETSGYYELAHVPVVPMGHSALATFPWNFAAWNPERTLAVLSIHGDAPRTNLTGYGGPNPDWGDKTIDGIPGLMVMGEYEWSEDRLTPSMEFRKNYPAAPVSLLADAGHGHFDHSDELIDYLILFLKKAVKYRYPSNAPRDEAPVLIAVDPQNGWLAERWQKDEKPSSKAASWKQYAGDKDLAFWYFDKEMADATEKYYASVRGKKEQYLGAMQNGKLLEYSSNYQSGIKPEFMPGEDGLTFHLSPVFTNEARSAISDEHARAVTEISRICGPVEKLNDTTFTVRFYRMGLNNQKRTGEIWLLAHNKGDKEYKSAVQPFNISIPYRNTEGLRQEIKFTPIAEVLRNTTSVNLNATSSSGLPVYFYVKQGPAEVKDGKLVISKMPPRTKFPVQITVMAWQYGKTGENAVQTAEPVERSFYIR